MNNEPTESKNKSGPEISPKQEYERIINYLFQLTGAKPRWLQRVTAHGLVIFEKLTTKTLPPFERVMKHEGEKGSAGPVGNYGFYFQPIGQTFEQMCQQLLKVAKQHKNVKYPIYNPPPLYPNHSVPEYPARKKSEPSCVITLPDNQRVQIHLSLLETIIRNKDEKTKLPLLHQALLEGIGTLPKDLQQQIKKSQVDLTRETDQEPPLLSIALSRNITSDPANTGPKWTWERNPQVFLAITMEEKPGSAKLSGCFAELGHVPIYGIPALKEVIALLTANGADTNEQSSVEPLPQVQSKTWTSLFKEGDEVVFPDENPSLLDLAKLMGIFEVDVQIEVPKWMMNWLLANKSRFGGQIGIWTLAGLLTSGQATFFPANRDDGDLQIALGLGGGDLLAQLRPLLQHMRNKKSLGEMDEKDIEQITAFFNYWERNKFQEMLKEEISSTKKGFGTATALAQATGVRLRNVIENIFGVLMPTLLGFLKSRMQISSLGRLDQSIAKKVKSIAFFTAGSKDASVAIGILDRQLTGRFFTKDPLLLAEAMIRILEQRRDLATDAKKHLSQVSNQHKAQLEKWLTATQNDGVQNAKSFLINGEKKSAMDFLRSIGNDLRIRREVLAFSHALITVLLQMAENNKDFKEMLAKEFKFLARQKMTWLIIHAMQLATISKINDDPKDSDQKIDEAIKAIFNMTTMIKSTEQHLISGNKAN